MKNLIILMILLNVFLVSAAERTTLNIDEEFLIDDKNITLLKADSRNDAAIFCVNGEKGIVREDGSNNINGVHIEITRIRADSVNIELNYECQGDCICGDECSNEACYEKDEVVVFVDEDQDDVVDDEEPLILGSSDDSGEIIENVGISSQGVVIAILIVFVLLLGVIVLWKRS